MNPDKEYDTIIIGSGIGGLVCGALLAKEGVKVLVAEQHSQVGGYCTSFKRKGYIFNPGAHLMGSIGNSKTSLGRIFTNLNLDVTYISVDPMDIFHFPNRVYYVPANLEVYIDMLQKNFPDEKENILSFFKVLKKIYRYFLRGKFKNPEMERYHDITYQSFLDNFFNNDELKAILSAQWGYVGLPPFQVSAIAMCMVLGSYLNDGAYLIKGGAQKLSNALARKIKEFGGDVKLNCRVGKILYKNKRVIGIQLSNGEVICSKIIVSNADANLTCFHLLNMDDIDKIYARHIRNMKKSISFFTLLMGVNLEREILEKIRGWHYKSYNINDLSNKPLYISIPTLHDKSLAPKDRHIIQIFTVFPYIYTDIKDWKSCKVKLEEKLLSYIQNLIPEIKSHIEVLESATPKTFEQYTSNSMGSGYGWAKTPEQIYFDMAPTKKLLDGFYRVGHWTPWGYGTAGVSNSGRYVAKMVLQHLTTKEP